MLRVIELINISGKVFIEKAFILLRQDVVICHVDERDELLASISQNDYDYYDGADCAVQTLESRLVIRQQPFESLTELIKRDKSTTASTLVPLGLFFSLT